MRVDEDWESRLVLFLEGIEHTAKQAATTARRLIASKHSHRRGGDWQEPPLIIRAQCLFADSQRQRHGSGLAEIFREFSSQPFAICYNAWTHQGFSRTEPRARETDPLIVKQKKDNAMVGHCNGSRSESGWGWRSDCGRRRAHACAREVEGVRAAKAKLPQHTAPQTYDS